MQFCCYLSGQDHNFQVLFPLSVFLRGCRTAKTRATISFWRLLTPCFLTPFFLISFLTSLCMGIYSCRQEPMAPIVPARIFFFAILLSCVRSCFQSWHLESTWSFGRVLEALSLFLILWKLGSTLYFKIWKLIRVADGVSLRPSQKLHQRHCLLDSNCLGKSAVSVNIFFWNSVKWSYVRCWLGK